MLCIGVVTRKIVGIVFEAVKSVVKRVEWSVSLIVPFQGDPTLRPVHTANLTANSFHSQSTTHYNHIHQPQNCRTSPSHAPKNLNPQKQ